MKRMTLTRFPLANMLRCSALATVVAAASPALAQPGDTDSARVVYVADQASDTIQMFDADTGAFTGTFASASSGDPLRGPRNLAIGPDGDLWAVNFSSSSAARQLVSFDLATGDVRTAVNITRYTEEPVDMAFINNQVYVLGNDTRNVAVYNLDGTFVREFGFPRVGTPSGFMLDQDGLMHIPTFNTALGSDARNEVQVWNPSSGTLLSTYGETSLPRFDLLLDIAQSPDGASNFVLNWDAGSVLRFDANTFDLVETIDAGLRDARTIEFSPDGSLMVSTLDGILRLNESTGLFETFVDTAGAGLVRPTGFVIVPSPATAVALALGGGFMAGPRRRRARG